MGIAQSHNPNARNASADTALSDNSVSQDGGNVKGLEEISVGKPEKEGEEKKFPYNLSDVQMFPGFFGGGFHFRISVAV